MNILLFPTRFYPAISGGDFYIQRLGEEFRRKKDHVRILTSNAIDFAALHGNPGRTVEDSHRNFTQYRDLEVDRLKALRFNGSDDSKLITTAEGQEMANFCRELLGLDEKNIQMIIDNGPLLPTLHSYFKIKPNIGIKNTIIQGLLKGFSPEIIHCSYFPYANLLYTLLLGQILEIPTIVTPFLHEFNVRYQRGEILEILKKFDRIIACTNHEKAFFTQGCINTKQIEVLPMGVDTKKFKKKDQSKPLALTFGIKPPVILFCGNKNYEKGAITLLNSIPLIGKVIPNVTFIFIGSSTPAFNYTLAELKRNLVTARILNLSPENLNGIFDPKKIGAFQIADIYCMPSRSEAYGISYLEAWACQKPVIAADFPAMHEVIKDNRDGILIPFDNPNALSEAIIVLLNNPNRCAEMGRYGYEKVIINNVWENIGKQTENLYDNTISQYKKRDPISE